MIGSSIARSTFKAGPRKVTSVSMHIGVWYSFVQLSECPQSTLGAYSRAHVRSANQRVQKVRGSRSTSRSFLILFTCAISCIKSKGLPIDVPIEFMYFLYMQCCRLLINVHYTFHTQSALMYEKQGASISIYIYHTAQFWYLTFQYKFGINKVYL
jgi:hypothetical protein